MKKIHIDNRWNGSGGIGTFTHEINKINNYDDAGFTGKPYSPFDFIKTSIKLFKKKGRIIFFPGYIPPIFSREPYVFTIHDLNHLDRRENTSLFKRLFYKYIILLGCKRAKYILTVSDFSKKRIISWSGVHESKVVNVGNGVSKEFSPIGEDLGYPFEYCLCVSNRKAHKNELRTLSAFKESELPNQTKLVFTGNPDDTIKKHITDLNLDDRVFFTGYLEQNDLPRLYRGAKALLFISLYEGFGLPIVEAMACGIPVVTSTTSSLPEVAGSAAILVEPTNIQDIAQAIRIVYFDKELRERLICAGLEQARKFSWEGAATKINALLLKI